VESFIRICSDIFESYFNPNIFVYNFKHVFLFRGGTCMKLITLHLPEPYIDALDTLVDDKYYPNRAEAIRVAIRDLLTLEVWERKNHG